MAYTRVAQQLKTHDLRKLGNVRKVSKPDRMIAQHPISPPTPAANPRKKGSKPPVPCAISHKS